MKTARAVVGFLVLACGAQAGVLRVISYPFRVSPVRLFTPPAKVIIFPFRHPKRFWVHGPTLPPDPWDTAAKVV